MYTLCDEEYNGSLPILLMIPSMGIEHIDGLDGKIERDIAIKDVIIYKRLKKGITKSNINI